MLLETFAQDLRLGLRVLLKEKSFCALAVFVLALGICGVTTMFSVVNGTMLRGQIQNFLVGVTPYDPSTYAAVAALLAVVSFLATFGPARRATRVDPMVALRAE